MTKMKVRCPICGAVDTMIDIGCIKNVMHEKCTKCGHIQEMSLARCLRDRYG